MINNPVSQFHWKILPKSTDLAPESDTRNLDGHMSLISLSLCFLIFEASIFDLVILNSKNQPQNKNTLQNNKGGKADTCSSEDL